MTTATPARSSGKPRTISRPTSSPSTPTPSSAPIIFDEPVSDEPKTTTQPDTGEIVVLGKTSMRKTEYPHLFTFGRALAARGKGLITTATPGAAAAVADGFRAEGGTPTFLPANPVMPDHDRVVVFTDNKMRARLTERVPDWQQRGWLVINNPKETEQAAEAAVLILAEHGQTLSDGGSDGPDGP